MHLHPQCSDTYSNQMLSSLRGAVYDAVVMLGCCGFGRHPTKVLDEILRITRPGKFESRHLALMMQ